MKNDWDDAPGSANAMKRDAAERDKPEIQSGLAMLRSPFPAHQISVFPKNAGQKAGLSYVGHAALTDRLLDADPLWAWEPLSVDDRGLPVIDDDGGMWIRLTVCGVTRLGYGDAQGKTGGNAMKERIGDALRNAAMRFGAALDLWHKGDLHIEEAEAPATISVNQEMDLAALITEVGADKAAFLTFAKLERLADMKASDYEKAVKALNKKREVAA